MLGKKIKNIKKKLSEYSQRLIGPEKEWSDRIYNKEKKPFKQKGKENFLHLKHIFEIGWNKLKTFYLEIVLNPKNTALAILSAPIKIKCLLCASVSILILSIGLISLGIYTIATNEIPDNGGELWEGFVGTNIKNINPVLEHNSTAEKRIADLIYSPLFTVKKTGSDTKIDLILLKKEPKIDGNSILFELKPNLKWSNGQSITSEDVEYSFYRLQENGGNNNFNQLFKTLILSVKSTLEFKIESNQPVNLDLVHKLNFRPISKFANQSQTNLGLLTDSKSLSPKATSGLFIVPENIIDPYSDSKSPKRSNPIRNNITNKIEIFGLEKDTGNKNDTPKPFLDKYYVNIANSITENIQSGKSLSKALKDQKLQIVSGENIVGNFNLNEIEDDLKFSKKNYQSQNKYTLFPSLKDTTDNYFNDLVLRKYLLCRLNLLKLENSFLNQNCGKSEIEIQNELTSLKDKRNTQIYKLIGDGSGKQLFYYNVPITVNILNSPNTPEAFLDIFKSVLISSGLQPLNRQISTPIDTTKELTTNEKSYHLALLKTSADITGILSPKQTNINQVNLADKNTDKNLLTNVLNGEKVEGVDNSETINNNYLLLNIFTQDSYLYVNKNYFKSNSFPSNYISDDYFYLEISQLYLKTKKW